MSYIYEDTPYNIYRTNISYGKDYWDAVKVEIFEHTTKIGEYIRGYHSFSIETFHPFQLDGIWYALYSDEYTATKIAKLTGGFQYWCGEEPSENGFCPTEFYVPKLYFYKDEEPIQYSSPHKYPDIEPVEMIYTRYGFISGCHWGDDSSWKLRYIDLSDIHNKNFKIEEKFGRLELCEDRSLKDSIYIDEYESGMIQIDCTKTFTL
jgi:hypothetical protein